MTYSASDALRVYCSTEASRPQLHAPISAVFAGERWAVATDGHRILAVRDEDRSLATVDPTEHLVTGLPNVWATMPTGGVPFDFAALRAFLDAEKIGDTVTCEDCGQTGRVECERCDGDGEKRCECIECGDEHYNQCRQCKGYGDLPCPTCKGESVRLQEAVRIGGVLFDVAVIRAGVGVLPADVRDVRWAQDAKDRVAVINGPGWRAGFMPMRETVVEKLAREVRVFDGIPSLAGVP